MYSTVTCPYCTQTQEGRETATPIVEIWDVVDAELSDVVG